MSKKMKLLSVLLVFALVLVACGSGNNNNQAGASNGNASGNTGTSNSSDSSGDSGSDGGESKAGQKIKVAMIPKAIGNSYFAAAAGGAEEAAKELNIDFVFNGPTELDASQQVSMINGYVAQGYDVLAISAVDPTSLVPALKEAQKKGVHVITWDSDVQQDAREYYVNAATSEGIGSELARLASEKFSGESVEAAVISSTPTDPNQLDWIGALEQAIKEKYTNISIVTTQYDYGEPATAQALAGDVLKAYPNVKVIFAMTSYALPAAAEAVDKAGKKGQVYVTGLANPDVVREYVHSGVIEEFVLWDVVEMGKLTMHVARAIVDGTMPESGTFKAGDLGEYELMGDNVMLGLPFVFNAENVDDYHY